MSMIGNYRRLSAEDLRKLLAEPDSLSTFLYREDEDDPAGYLDIDKSWHIIHFLLNGDPWEGPWPLGALVLGGAEVSGEDIGYGPARYLLPDEVAEMSEALAKVAAPALLARWDAEAIRAAEIYPGEWSKSDIEQAYIVDYYESLRSFFASASRSGEAVVLYLN